MLKIAISKLQNDFEKVINQIKYPIDLKYSNHSDNGDNLLLKLEKVIEEKEDLFDNEKISMNLDESSNILNSIKNFKMQPSIDYSDENQINENIRTNRPQK